MSGDFSPSGCQNTGPFTAQAARRQTATVWDRWDFSKAVPPVRLGGPSRTGGNPGTQNLRSASGSHLPVSTRTTNFVLDDADYVVGSGDDVRVAVGALLEILLAIAGIATAVVIFPIVKRVNEAVALGYVATRTVESILILVGVVSLMSVVALRQDLADGANSSGALTDVAGGLLAVHD